jgi:integrase/recombinase XerD
VAVDEAGRVRVLTSVHTLHPEDQAVEDMLLGWRNQQLSRNLQFATIDQRLRYVRRFIESVNEFPWRWTPMLVEEYFGDLRSVRHLSNATIRAHQAALRHFTSYISNPDYGWDVECERLFGEHPAQVFFDWNTAPHVQEFEGGPSKRPFTRDELQRLFDYADWEVERVATSRVRGWQAAYRDATMLKVAYSFGLRFNELRHLQLVDFARNPHAPEFGKYGVCKARFGKSRRASPPKPRAVLTVFSWTPEVIQDWLSNGRGSHDTLDVFPNESGALVSEPTLLRRLRRYCEILDFPTGLDLHSLRRSYATHLLEDGWDPLFVQAQMGHEHASTTGIYTFVSSSFRTSTLRQALDRTVRDALEGRS